MANWNGSRFYTALDMSIVKHDAARRNMMIKRGEQERGGTEYVHVCGCGTVGCFLHVGGD